MCDSSFVIVVFCLSVGRLRARGGGMILCGSKETVGSVGSGDDDVCAGTKMRNYAVIIDRK